MPVSHVQFHDKELYHQLTVRGAGGSSVGLVAERCLYRYLLLCTNSCPTFTTWEWCAIFDSLNGCWLHEGWSPRYLSVEVADCLGLGEKWAIDQDALVARLQALNYGECIAVVDASERFWATDTTGNEDWYDAISPIVGRGHITRED